MNTNFLIWIIVGQFLATYPVRLLPLILFNRMETPMRLKRWLSFVPITVFAALITQILWESLHPATDFNWPLYIGMTVTFLVTIRAKSFAWGLGLGYAVYCLLLLKGG